MRLGPGTMLVRHARRLFELKNLLVLNFLCLSINLFFLVMQLNHGFWPPETFFRPSVTPEDRAAMMETLHAFTHALDAHNLTYFMYAGTLIGSYRHHGPIPWDDDVDVMLNASQKARVRDALRGLRPDYDVYIYGEDLAVPAQWKFFRNSDSGGYMFRSFKWPYIDVFFFAENATHIWDEVPRFQDKYKYRKSHVFPLKRRPFGGLSLYSPCDPATVLQTNYKVELCRSRQFNHMMELPMFQFNTKDVPCSQLQHVFPFVQRTFGNGFVNETLRLGEWSLHSVTVPSHCKGS